MFTGIVQGLAKVNAITGSNTLKTFQLKFPEQSLSSVTRGASIAINGTCLTVTEFDTSENVACFDVMHESLSKTNLSTLNVGDFVNFERAAKFGDEIGGHLMSGHVFTTTRLINQIKTEQQCTLFFELSESLKKYIMPKGFIGLNGCSLTIGEVDDDAFNVHLIPETLAVTTFGTLSIGDVVNLEIDPQTQAIVDTVERIIASKKD